MSTCMSRGSSRRSLSRIPTWLWPESLRRGSRCRSRCRPPSGLLHQLSLGLPHQLSLGPPHRLSLGLPHRLSLGLSLLVMLGLAGCDRSPKGPGSWEALLEPVSAAAASAGLSVGTPGVAFLAVTGTGIEGFEADPGVILFAREVPGEPYHRVVVVMPEGNDPLRFRIRVRDRRAGVPTATPVEVFDRQNLRLPVQDVWRVRIRP